MKKESIALIIAGLAYSLMSFAYMHKTFPSRDLFEVIKVKLEKIEDKLDRLVERQ